MDNRDQNVRRWQIFMCQGGSVHIHYGTGSLHINKEDFPGLAQDLHAIALSLENEHEVPKQQREDGPLH